MNKNEKTTEYVAPNLKVWDIKINKGVLVDSDDEETTGGDGGDF